MSYNSSNKSTFLCNYHIIFCPKYRKSILTGKLKNRLEKIIEDVAYENSCEILAKEIMPDHVHLFISTNPEKAPFKLVKAFKGRTSNLLRKEFPELLKMPSLWTRSYFLSTVGNLSSETIINYIENQWTK